MLSEAKTPVTLKQAISEMEAFWPQKRIIFTHNTTKYLFLHYQEFLKEFISREAEVIVLAPFDDTMDEIRSMGARCINIVMSRQGINPASEVATLMQIYRVIKRENPNVVFNYSIKPVIYASIGTRWHGVENVFSMITGLGHIFTDQTMKYKLLRSVILPLYRTAIRANSAVFFQNPDDKRLFVDYGLINDAKGFVVNGTGIDLESFFPKKNRLDEVKFILISRLLWSKGIKEYVDVAGILKRRYPEVKFQILGMFDDNPTSIHKEQIETWQSEGVVDYLGSAEDVRPFLEQASVFVLPTIYREGRPRAVVEAMAMGKPIITSDTPGCRETVVHGENGFLVPVKDVSALADAMEKFILNPDLVGKMGSRSREMAEEQYNVHEINSTIVSIMNRLVAA